MRTSSRQVIVLLFDEVELLDFAAPVQVLSIAGRHYNFRPFKITTAARAAGLVATRNQLAVQADCDFDACPAAEVLLVPGGYGARRALADTRLLAWIEAQARRAELILSAGYGCLLLAKAGVCMGQRLAVPTDIEDVFRELEPGAEPSSEQLVVSGKIVSVRDSARALDLGLSATRILLGPKFEAQVATRLGARLEIDVKAEPVRIVEPGD
ncbi:MAG TPA: DJ-1/PfpI family protein [Polyangiaceae bacterium]